MCFCAIKKGFVYRHAGKSRVDVSGFGRSVLGYHLWKRGQQKHLHIDNWIASSVEKSPGLSPRIGIQVLQMHASRKALDELLETDCSICGNCQLKL